MKLFTPTKLGSIEIRNRIVMAPLTRARAGESRIPNELMAEYYAQRATAGLIITEATSVEPMGVGYADTPGIWSEEQVHGWKKIVQAVHDKNSKIMLQLWHVGRISHPSFLNGKTPVAPSAIKPAGHVSLIRPETEYVTPRALELNEIPAIVESYRKGAENAKRAGFDGVEIHGANGYLIDQFLESKSNQRTDQYGGSIENRARFALEVADAVCSVWGADRAGFHISPRGDAHDVGDADPLALFTYLATELGRRKLAFLFARHHLGEGYIGDEIKAAFGGAYIINENLTRESAEEMLQDNRATAVSFGKAIISNPTLVEKLREGSELTALNPKTLYAKGPEGYIDYK